MLYIIDDDKEFVVLIDEISSSYTDKTNTYTNPIEFLKDISINNEDVIILDIKMPSMDGVEVLREFAQKRVLAPIILISGIGEEILSSTLMLANELGLNIVGKLVKPFKPSELTKLLNGIKVKESLSSEVNEYQTSRASYTFTRDEILYALDNKLFCLYYQPQIDLNTQVFCSVEALVRWNHPKLGVIAPNDFLPYVANFGLLDELTDYVIEEVIGAEANWSRLGLEVDSSININASNVINLTLPEKLESLINNVKIKPERICLEVTESELMTELIPSMDTLTRLRVKGFRLSIDDFGTGFSSLLQLYRIPFNELKIDRSFIRNLTSDTESKIIVESCIYLAHKLGMKVVAEGIEDKDTLIILKELGCDIGQGYYFSKPLPERDVYYWLHENIKKGKPYENKNANFIAPID